MNYRLCWGWCTGMSQPEWVGHFYSTCNETRWCSDSLRGFQSQCTPSVGVRTIPSTAHRWFVCKFGWRERNSSKLIPVRHTCKCVLMRTRELLTPVTHRSLHRHCRLAPAILFCTIKSKQWWTRLLHKMWVNCANIWDFSSIMEGLFNILFINVRTMTRHGNGQSSV